MRKQQKIGSISAREARVAMFLAGCHKPAEPEKCNPVEVEKKRKATQTTKERKDAWKLRKQVKEMKVPKAAPQTAKERKDAWKLRQHPKDGVAPATSKERKDKWKLRQQLKEMKAPKTGEDLACPSRQPPQKRTRQQPQ